jgi:transcriptional regulator with XRE-family HTH domain
MATKKSEKEPTLAGTFGSAVRALREKAGLTQDKLAYQAEITPTYMSQIERGLKNVTLPILWNLARALRMKPSDLVRDTEKKFRGAEAGSN